MWISKQELNAMLAFEYTRGWNHAYLPPQDYTEWAGDIEARKTKGIPPPALGIPHVYWNAFNEED